MITVETIPTDWIEILKKVQSVAPNQQAVLAGGALRDQDNGRPIKDLDIFVPVVSKNDWQHLMYGLRKVFGLHLLDFCVDISRNYLNLTNDEVTGITTFYTRGTEGVSRTWFDAPFESVGAVEVNVIGLNLPNFSLVEAVKRIDIGFCRIGFNGDHLWKTEEYLKDQRDKTMTVLYAPTVPALKRSKSRYDRLFKKYPDFCFINKSGTAEDNWWLII